jgi:hypothetical protein
MVALAFVASREIIMRKLTVVAAMAFLAASIVSLLPWHRTQIDGPLGSISPHELTLAGSAMAAGQAPDAF